MIFIIEFSAVFTLAKEDLPAAWVHFGVLGHIVDPPVEDGPAIVLLIVLGYLIWGVVGVVWVLY